VKRIGLLSDTHGFFDSRLKEHFKDCDEVWHAGDWGSEVAEVLEASFKTVRGVFGNIDGRTVRAVYPEDLFFEVEGLKVYITHIGGYPGRYAPKVKEKIDAFKAKLFITGHSHILKVMPDKLRPGLLHINPGAAGLAGFHIFRTAVRFSVEQGIVKNLEVIQLGKRGAL
jgi:putative phosphoesterase